MTIIEQLARKLNRPAEHIENVVRLLDEGNTCLLYTSDAADE